MSMSKPVAKQPRMMGQSAVTRSETVPLTSSDTTEEERNRRSSTPRAAASATDPTSSTTTVKNSHPKGHKVRELKEVWDMMDAQAFLHLTDTLTLGDVWVQPKYVEPTTNLYVTITFIQMIVAPHIKWREAKSKMSVDDLMKMLYLNDCIQWDMQCCDHLDYDTWIAEKTAAFIRTHGVDDSTNRSKVCNFIISEDREFTFYPRFLKSCCGVFFRKICYHSYKDATDGETSKIVNPSMVKCSATRGKFEYMIEARILPLPIDWFERKLVDVKAGEMPEMPASQAL